MYITAEEYENITGRAQSEATPARIKRASMFLDARIGNHVPDEDTGLKLDIEELPLFQENIVQEWVALMTAFLFDNGDVSPSTASVSLGRFSVTEHGQKNQSLPESMVLADALLSSSGLIRRGVKMR